jgi:hypothetical protein
MRWQEEGGGEGMALMARGGRRGRNGSNGKRREKGKEWL